MSQGNIVQFMPQAPLIEEKPRSPLPSVLKRISPKHREVIKLHLQGLGREDIADFVGYTPQRITQLLADPLIQQAMEEEYEYIESQLRALTGGAVEVIRDSLHDQNPDVRLKGARLQMEATGRFKNPPQGGDTAEDVVAKIISLHTNGAPVQINITTPLAERKADT